MIYGINQSIDNVYRFYFAPNNTTYICGGGAATDAGLIVYSSGASGGYNNNLTILNNGNTTIRGTLTNGGAINLNGDMLKFPDTLNQYKINLWGTNVYGFGIASGTVMYSSQIYHKFYNSANNVNTFTIDSVGNISSAGSLTVGSSLQVNTTANISSTLNVSSTLTVGGNLSGCGNVSKRAIFAFTPNQVLIGGLGLRWIHEFSLASYISKIVGPAGNDQYIFRIHIWSTSGDFGDTPSNVETMTYLIYYAAWGGGVKVRQYELANNSNGSFISTSTWPKLYYNGWNGTGGSSQKYCVIENISGY